MKRVVVAAAAAAGLLVASGAGVSACATYCDWDPIVVVATPGGHLVPVYDSVWTSNLLQPGMPTESYAATRTYVEGKPATRVDMTIYVPTGLLLSYSTMDEVTTGLLGSGTVLARTYGTSGSPVHLEFTLPES